MTKYRIIIGSFDAADGSVCHFKLERLKEGTFWNRWVSTKALSHSAEKLKEAIHQVGGELME